MPLEIELLLAAWDNVKKNMHQPEPYEQDVPVMTDRQAELFDKVEDAMRQLALEYDDYGETYALFGGEDMEEHFHDDYEDDMVYDIRETADQLPDEPELAGDVDALAAETIAADLMS
jgi:hypothetical protein